MRLGDSIANLEGLETVERYRQRDGSDVGHAKGVARPAPRRTWIVAPHLFQAWRRTLLGGWMVVLLAAAGVLVPIGPLAAGRAAAAPSPHDVGAVQAVYAADLLSRVNAERAARSAPGQPVPPLTMNGGLDVAAQAWSDYIASTGVVEDPSLPGCGNDPGPTQMCVMAANSGSSGNGYWPGDGSDGMEGAYMASAGHRENMLNAGYESVGIGVTCSGGQAFTVELFGYAYGNVGLAESLQAAQNAVEGDPVPAGPSVAGVQTGVPVYCPGQTVGPNGTTTATGGQYPYPYPVPSVADEPVPPAPAPIPFVGVAASAGDDGYWEAKADGTVVAHGAATAYGSMAGRPLAAPITHIVATPDGHGYWLVGADGGIFAFGDAAFYGSMGGLPLDAPVVDMAPTPDGHGYWLVGADGGIFAFGDAAFYGSMGGQRLNAPVVGMSPDATGHGYWLVGADGGIFAFGDAAFHGSMGGQALNAPVVGMSTDATGHGYWLVGADGGIFTFGDAPYEGSTGSLTLNAPVVAIATDRSTGGYWLAAADGGIFAFDAPFDGAG